MSERNVESMGGGFMSSASSVLAGEHTLLHLGVSRQGVSRAYWLPFVRNDTSEIDGETT
jgi:hypothetical protein